MSRVFVVLSMLSLHSAFAAGPKFQCTISQRGDAEKSEVVHLGPGSGHKGIALDIKPFEAHVSNYNASLFMEFRRTDRLGIPIVHLQTNLSEESDANLVLPEAKTAIYCTIDPT